MLKITMPLGSNEGFKLKNSSPFTGSLSEDQVSSFLLLTSILAKHKKISSQFTLTYNALNL
jgi:hypothetical protein